jgi:aryl-alcohol dehydrogenase-like predicted oxidoreductase
VAAGFATFAERKGCTSSELALAWILKQGQDMFVIPGTTKAKYIEENWKAIDVVLTDEDERELREFVSNAELLGESETPAGQIFAFVNTKEESN